MKQIHDVLRSLAIICGITIALDVLVAAFVPARVLDPWIRLREGDARVYDRTVAWHHDIRPDLDFQRTWGSATYRYRTDRHGFRTGECAGNDAPGERDRTAFLVGDSFAEGLGVSFEDSVAGLLACAYRERGLAMRNLGVAGYSPTMYWRKVESAAERLGFPPREVVILLDISDVFNEAVEYVEKDGRVAVSPDRIQPPDPPAVRVKSFLRRNSVIFAVASDFWSYFDHREIGPTAGLGDKRSRWTVDKAELASIGEPGLRRSAANLEKIVNRCEEWRCRITLVVYPWPDQIAHNDRDSIQVRYWRAWAARNGVHFIDAFGPFFAQPARKTIGRYYIVGDVHFNEAGNRLLFDEIRRQLPQL